MELILDNQPLAVPEEGNTPLRAVFQRVTEELRGRNRVICEVFIDGAQQGSWDDPKIAERKVGDCRLMRLVSEEPRRLAQKVLYEIAGYMPKIKNALVECSTRLQSRKETEGMELLEEITATWVELYQGLQSALTVTGLDYDSVSVQGNTFLQINEEIHQYLEEVADLVQNQQFLELSDILEYEIAPRIPLLEECIYQFIKQLEKQAH